MPNWEIQLAWRQKLAAYWSISWPAIAATFVLALAMMSYVPDHVARAHPAWIGLAANVSFFLVQAVLINRIVRKEFSTFRVVVLRDDGQETRSLSARESISVWLWILGPQFAAMLIASVIAWFHGSKLPAETVRSISELWLLLRFLAVGPYAVGLALRVRYRGFRLKSYGYRYV